jgi:fibronectin type 3 domain-containing protein
VAPPLAATFSNRKVALNWSVKTVAEQYFATVLEKSKNDSLHFAPFSIPMIKIRTHAKSTDDDFEVNYTDNIINGEAVYYRIKGLTLFGVAGNSSNTISGMAGPDLTAPPVITGVAATENNKALLQWSLPDSLKPIVAAYEIWQSVKFDSGYQKVAEVKAGVPFLQQVSVTALPVNYFVVKAVGTRKGQSTASDPYMYQLIDSIAPVAPAGLTGKVDTNGVVTLTWKSNTENDLLGYRVFKSTSQKEEFILLNATPGNTVIYMDTLPLKQLNKAMYYKVAAVDQRYNESSLSAVTEVKRPDKIPPALARLKAVTYKNGRLQVSWLPSFSQDVVSYQIFRMASDDTTHAWNRVATVKNTDTVYADKDIKKKVKYSYAIQAIDDAGLVSALSPAFVGMVPESSELKKGVRNFNTYVSKQYKYIELNWQDNDEATNEYWLYKAVGTGKFTLIATLPGSTKKYVDENLRNAVSYHYAIKVVYKDGTGSKMEKTEVTY